MEFRQIKTEYHEGSATHPTPRPQRIVRFLNPCRFIRVTAIKISEETSFHMANIATEQGALAGSQKITVFKRTQNVPTRTVHT